MRNFLIVILLVLAPTFAQASEEELREAYASYQEAVSSWELGDAATHAEQAYAAGLELYGFNTQNTALLALNYGNVLNEIGEYQRATTILQEGIASLVGLEDAIGQASYNLHLELGRSRLGMYDPAGAVGPLEAALIIAEDTFGIDSREAGLAHFYLALIPFRHAPGNTIRDIPLSEFHFEFDHPHSGSRSFLVVENVLENHASLEIGTSWAVSVIERGGREHLVIAQEIFEQDIGWQTERADAHALSAAYMIALDWDSAAFRTMFQAAIALYEMQHANQFVIPLLDNWMIEVDVSDEDREEVMMLMRAQRRLATLTVERGLPSGIAYLSDPNEISPISRTPPNYPMSAIERGQEGFVYLRFDVTSTGSTQNIEVVRSFPGSTFDSTSVRAIRRFRYEPRRVDGVPVDRPGVTFMLFFTMETGQQRSEN